MKPSRDDIIAKANEIAEEYRAMDLNLTLRQMFYQLVARGFLDNSDREYSRVGAALTAARYDGRFPLDAIVDRGREVIRGDFTRNEVSGWRALQRAGEIIEDIPELVVRRGRWYGQARHVSVWVEKQALSGIFAPVCKRLGVSWFACKGYPSVSALSDWIDQTELGGELGYRTPRVICYFGDFDPDGWQIPRSSVENIAKLQDVKEHWFEVELKRVALTMNQIRTHSPPPFHAKMTSSRYESYVREHGTTNAWELDALDPATLRRLIEREVMQWFDWDVHEKNRELVADVRSELIRRMKRDAEAGWLAEIFE